MAEYVLIMLINKKLPGKHTFFAHSILLMRGVYFETLVDDAQVNGQNC